MAVEVISNKNFEAVCKTCQCTVRFSSKDVMKVGGGNSKKRGSWTVYGVQCPNCNTAIKLDEVAPVAPPPPPAPPALRVIKEGFGGKSILGTRKYGEKIKENIRSDAND